jgi:hypothetical protein
VELQRQRDALRAPRTRNSTTARRAEGVRNEKLDDGKTRGGRPEREGLLGERAERSPFDGERVRKVGSTCTDLLRPLIEAAGALIEAAGALIEAAGALIEVAWIVDRRTSSVDRAARTAGATSRDR